ncbi:MAG: hypothetical protein GC184_07865 [Rhizobiales bacterium]|nr:hypothetical protein [Hyphomicrobiales bacterium]
MLNRLFERMIRKTEKQTGESADYLRDISAAAPSAFWRFLAFTPLSQHRGPLPLNAACAARIAAIHAEDCGPCLQITINLALAAGANPDLLRAAVNGDLEAMDADSRLAFRFAEAIAKRDLQSEDLRPDIEARWGKAGLAELALAIASVRVYPTLKRTMGYGQACQRVHIEKETLDATLPALRGHAA